MKKLICLLFICITIIPILIGCDSTPIGEVTPAEIEPSSSRFQKIASEKLADNSGKHTLEDAHYYVDRYTNIMYVYIIDWDGNYTRGMMAVLYNAEGKPMTLEEFEKEIE